MNSKRKRKNGQKNYRRFFTQLRQFISLTFILATLPITLLLVAYNILLFGRQNYLAVYWVQSSPSRLTVLTALILIASSIRVARRYSACHPSTLFWKHPPLYVVLSWFLCIFLLCGVFVSSLFYIFPYGYQEVIQVENHGLHTYSSQYTETDESYTYRYSIYKCQFDLFCEQIYNVFKYARITYSEIESISFNIDSPNNKLKIIENGVLTSSIALIP